MARLQPRAILRCRDTISACGGAMRLRWPSIAWRARALSSKDGNGQHTAQLALVTSDMAEAVGGAELILCPAPAFAQHDIARQLAPHLADGQVVFLPPATFGSMIFAVAARDAGNRARLSFAETGTLPWLTRKHEPFEVAITIRAKRLPVGVFPLKTADHALDVIRRAFPRVIEPCGDALSGSADECRADHPPPLIVMNAGPIEHFERWDIHKEGTQASIRAVTDALDAERIAVRERLGYGSPHFPLAHHYTSEGEQWMYGRGSHDRLTDSGDWRERIVLSKHRYCAKIYGSACRVRNTDAFAPVTRIGQAIVASRGPYIHCSPSLV